MELAKKKIMIIAAVGIVIFALGTYNFLYAPLINELKAKYLECKNCENDVFYARNLIESVKVVGKDSPLLTEEDISIAIDELTKHGKSRGINFISMTPQEKQKKTEAQYEILPIEMELESTYEELGTFLGSLDEMQNSLITVRSFGVSVFDEEDQRKLETELVVNMYLLGEKYAK